MKKTKGIFGLLSKKTYVYILLWVIVVIWFLPFLSVFIASLRPFAEIRNGWWHFAEFNPSLGNFGEAWTHSSAPLAIGLFNSFFITGIEVLIQLAVATPAAYAFARLNFRGKNALFIFIVSLMAVPPVMIAGPLFQTYSKIGLLNTRIGVSLVHVALGLPWTLLFLRAFFGSLPVAVEEAAKVDGASFTLRFWRIALPMALPGVVSVAVLDFIGVWNNYFFPLILLFDPMKKTAVQMLPAMKGQYYVNWSVISAGAILTLAIPVTVYVLLHRYYVRGLAGYQR